MRDLLTREEARAMDAHAVATLAIPSLLLMENAGRGVADLLVREHAASLSHVVLVGGSGQNGGDAWVVARHLALAGVRITAILFDEAGRAPSGDGAVQFEIARRAGIAIHVATDLDVAMTRALDAATLIVDGLFGTGLSRPIVGAVARVVEAINGTGVVVVALDLPSGIDADTGQILGVAVEAAHTVTFGAMKRGLLQGPGAEHAGRVSVASIGAPIASPSRARIVDDADVVSRLAIRARDAHKGTAGHVLVVAGRSETSGAAILAARGAARGGAGLVTLATRADARASVGARVLETMMREFQSLADLCALTRGKRALVIGPGLGTGADERVLVEGVAFTLEIPVVLDADALTLLGPSGLPRLREAPAPRVLTPHPGEAGALLGVSSTEVQRDRHAAARALADRSGQVVVLKGAGTIVAFEGRPDLVVTRGTPALGTGGSGDVLAGVVGALVGSSDPQLDAAIAAHWHAAAGERAAIADRGLLASEIADALPATLTAFRAR